MGTGQVSENIGGVAAAAGSAGAAAALSSASELARQSEVLRAQVGKFLGRVRAA
jgi:methyl-accepting chemotaxis protein